MLPSALALARSLGTLQELTGQVNTAKAGEKNCKQKPFHFFTTSRTISSCMCDYTEISSRLKPVELDLDNLSWLAS
jgi:hypothetical protein